MKRFSLISLVVLLMMLSLVITACGGGSQQQPAAPGEENQKPITLKLGHMTTTNNPYHHVAVKFKELVEERTKGQILIEIYGEAQLGRDRELLEAMQFGNLDAGVITTSPMVNFIPEFGVLDLPYVFDDWDHVERFLDSQVSFDLFKESEKAKLVSLSLLPRGFRHLTNSKLPVVTPADLGSLKLRVIESPVYVDTFTALGAAAQGMSWGEVFTALQQKTIDGQENALNTIFVERIYEVNKYVSETGHMFAFAAIVLAKDVYEGLPADVQKIMAEAAVEAADIIGKEQRAQEADFKRQLEEKGMVFNAVEKDKFKALVKPVHDNFTAKNGDKYLKQIQGL